LESWTKLDRELSEIEILGDLAEEEGDEETAAEALARAAALGKAADEAEFHRMLSRPNDPNNAIVSINAGAGGTEAQDWAEMLLRITSAGRSGAASRPRCSTSSRGTRRASRAPPST
jgi:peptide chain release factor 2